MRTAVAIWHMLRYCINQSQVAAGTRAMVASVPVTGTGRLKMQDQKMEDQKKMKELKMQD